MDLFEVFEKPEVKAGVLNVSVKILDVEQLFLSCFPATSIHEKQKLIEMMGSGKLMCSLCDAIATFGQPIDFFGVIVPQLQIACRDAPTLFQGRSLPLLRSGVSSVVKLTRRQIRALSSMAFLGLMPPVAPGYGSMDWVSLFFNGHNRTAVERLKCQLQYFSAAFQWSDDVLDEVVTFERRCCAGSTPCFNTIASPLFDGEYRSLVVVDAASRMEDFTDATAHVDFANKQLHIGCIIPSCTQEEVMFSVRPELFVALPLFECLKDDEVACVYNTKRLSEYKGYGGTFSFSGPCADDSIQDTIIIDAIVNRWESQFSPDGIQRDLQKAFMGFVGHSVIATGHWGCGIFRGDKCLKFLQQAIAARQSKSVLRYSTFGNVVDQELLESVAGALAAARTPVGEIVRWMGEFEPTDTNRFAEFVMEMVEKIPKQQ